MPSPVLQQTVSTILSWPLKGHERMAGEAATLVLSADGGGVLGQAPPAVRERLKGILLSMSGYVRLPDYEGVLGGHWAPWGQAQHFMRPAGWPNKDAFEFGTNFIWNSILAAVAGFRHADDGQARLRLGEALHALQDSFSPAHVERVRNEAGTWVVKNIIDYNAQDSEEHEKGDASFQAADGGFSSLAQASVLASTMLLAYFVQLCLGHLSDAAALRTSLGDLYLSAAFS